MNILLAHFKPQLEHIYSDLYINMPTFQEEWDQIEELRLAYFRDPNLTLDFGRFSFHVLAVAVRLAELVVISSWMDDRLDELAQLRGNPEEFDIYETLQWHWDKPGLSRALIQEWSRWAQLTGFHPEPELVSDDSPN